MTLKFVYDLLLVTKEYNLECVFLRSEAEYCNRPVRLDVCALFARFASILKFFAKLLRGFWCPEAPNVRILARLSMLSTNFDALFRMVYVSLISEGFWKIIGFYICGC